MINETTWQKELSCDTHILWSWDETWLMRLPGKEMSCTLTCCWSWDETWLMRLLGCKQIKQCHLLTHPEVWHAWLMRLPGKEIKQCHSLSVGHGMRHDWWDCLANKESSVSHLLLVMEWLLGKEISQSYSLPVSHVGWDMMRHPVSDEISVLSPTHCWACLDEIQQEYLAIEGVTYNLYRQWPDYLGFTGRKS